MLRPQKKEDMSVEHFVNAIPKKTPANEPKEQKAEVDTKKEEDEEESTQAANEGRSEKGKASAEPKKGKKRRR